MTNRSDTDKAIRNIMEWAARPDWSAEMQAVFNAHIDPVCESFGSSREELEQEIAGHGYDGMLFGIMFEDFICRRLLPDGSNIIDDYLKRRGWRESVVGRRHLQQLRGSVLSLYEVVEVSPGKYCDLFDLVRKGKPVRVHEHMGTLSMARWDRIAARVLVSGKNHVFSGGVLAFTHQAAQDMLKVLTKARKRITKNLAKEFTRMADKEAIAQTLTPEIIDNELLQQACPAFIRIWLVDILHHLRAPLPEIINRDGESMVFTETRYPFEKENREQIIRLLDANPDWDRDSTDKPVWIWIPEANTAADTRKQGNSFGIFQESYRPVSGALELKVRQLVFTANSMERTERGKESLSKLLPDIIGPPLSMLQTPGQLLKKHDPDREGKVKTATANSVDPKIGTEIKHAILDKHYRECLDQPIPALDDKSPRQCISSKQGREKVIEWLKYLENQEQHHAASQGVEPYDCSWMWEELKLAEFMK